MSEPNSKLFRDDPATYYTELGAKAERERIIKLLEESDSVCSYWAIELVKRANE